MSVPAIDFHTAFGMTALSGWTLMGVLWLVGRHFPRQGVGLAMASVFFFGTSYLFIALSASLPFQVAMSLGYGCISAGIVAISFGVRRFCQQPWGRLDTWILLVPIVLTAVIYLAAAGNFGLFARLCNSLFLLQMGIFAALLWHLRPSIAGHGWKVMLIGVALQAITLAPVALFGRPATPPVSDMVSVSARLVLWAICLVMFLNLQVSVLAFLMMLLDRRTDQERHKAEMDELTQLPNRRSLERQVEQLMPLVQRQMGSMGVMLLDIDHFKQVNDHFGHDAGDAVLRHVAQVLNRRLREGELLARYGGEEFVVVLPSADASAAHGAAARFAEAVRSSTVNFRGQALTVTMSIGVHVQQLPARQNHLMPVWHEMVRAADVAMYQAKHAGRNRFVVTQAHVHLQTA